MECLCASVDVIACYKLLGVGAELSCEKKRRR